MNESLSHVGEELLQLTKVADSFGFLHVSLNRWAQADFCTVLNSFELL